jgi:signal transduction histidine kinase
VTLVVFAAAAIGMAVLIEHAQWAPLDAALQEEADTLAALFDLGHAAALDEVVARLASERDLGTPKFVRVTGSDGETLAQSGSVPDAVALLSSPAARVATVQEKGEAYRVVWCRAGGGWSQIGVNGSAHMRLLRRADWVIGGTAAGLLLCMSGLAWTITTRGTVELARLAAELETIEASSLDRRLAPRHTTEVDRLTTVLNRLLGRLEAAIDHLRRFTADAAHELRTPIAALRAHLDVAIGSAPSAEAYRNGLLDALEQTERLGRLAEDLLALSAVEAGVAGPAGQTEVVRLDVIAREVAEFLEPVAQEQGRRFTSRVEAPLLVHGTPALLKRLVLNLVDNAFRHTPPPAGVDVHLASSNGVVNLEVSDQGPGIPPDEVPLVFERFHRGRSASAGTGLGLALCREIVLRHHGNIALRSAPGVGTTVTVTLPLVSGGVR